MAESAHEQTLIGEVDGQACAIAIPVERDTEHLGIAIFVIDCYLAAPNGAVNAHAELTIGAKAATHVHRAAEMPRPGIVEGDAADLLVGCSLGNQIDPAPKSRPARRGAIEKCVRAVQNLNLIVKLGSDKLARRQPVHSIIGDIVGREVETPYHEEFRGCTERGARAYGGVVFEHLS